MNDDEGLRTFDQQTMRFDHPRNVHIDAGRIIFDQERGGWVLPGGRFTRDQGEARHAAATIDLLFKGAPQ